MVTIAIAIMIVAAFAAVAYPLLNNTRHTERSTSTPGDLTLENLVGQRDAAYAAIKELEFDYAMGKLSDGDYRVMRAKYETKAAGILQELDSIKVSRRQARGAGAEDSIEREVRQLRQNSAASPLQCPKCGTQHTYNDAFCSKCGTSLRGARCPNCGTRAAAGDRFCARCGGRIGVGS